MTYAKVRPGQPLAIPAEAYNAMLDAAIAYKNSRHTWASGDTLPTTPPTIKILNATPNDVPRFGVIGLGQPIVLPSENLTQFHTPAFRGILPAPGKPFAITAAPIPAGTIGPAIVTGITVCRLTPFDPDPNEALYAEPQSNNTTTLRTYPGGTLRILWREPGDTGDKWAIAVFQPNPHPLVRVRLTQDLTKDSAALVDAELLTRGADGLYAPGSRPTIKVGDLSGLGFYATAMTKATAELHFGLTINSNFYDVIGILTDVRCG